MKKLFRIILCLILYFSCMSPVYAADTIRLRGIVNAQSIAQNVNIILDDDTTINMDRDLTVSSITGKHILALTGDYQLSVTSDSSTAIDVGVLEAAAPVYVQTSGIGIEADYVKSVRTLYIDAGIGIKGADADLTDCTITAPTAFEGYTLNLFDYCRVSGNVRSSSLTSYADTIIEGNVETGSLLTDNVFLLRGELNADEVSIKGNAQFENGNGISASKVEIGNHGDVRVYGYGSIRADYLYSEGIIFILSSGGINADTAGLYGETVIETTGTGIRASSLDLCGRLETSGDFGIDADTLKINNCNVNASGTTCGIKAGTALIDGAEVQTDSISCLNSLTAANSHIFASGYKDCGIYVEQGDISFAGVQVNASGSRYGILLRKGNMDVKDYSSLDISSNADAVTAVNRDESSASAEPASALAVPGGTLNVNESQINARCGYDSSVVIKALRHTGEEEVSVEPSGASIIITTPVLVPAVIQARNIYLYGSSVETSGNAEYGICSSGDLHIRSCGRIQSIGSTALYAAALDAEDSVVNIDAGFCGIDAGQIQLKDNDLFITATGENAAALHASGNIAIRSGIGTVMSGKTGIHAEGTLEFSDTQLDIITDETAAKASDIRLVSCGIKEPENGYIRSGSEAVIADSFGETAAEAAIVPLDDSSLFKLYRIGGSGRTETSTLIAGALKEALHISEFDAVVVCDSTKFPDALSASSLAIQKKAPILLVSNAAKSQNTISTYIKNNLSPGGKVYIIGGESAVSKAFEDNIRNTVSNNVERIAGANRYLTNLEVLKKLDLYNEQLMVATGKDFPDALSASATGMPLMLMNGNSFSSEQLAFLRKIKGSVTIIGGPTAIHTVVEDILNNLIMTGLGIRFERLNGSGRYNTSRLIAETYYTDARSAILACGSNFPDGLCAGPLAYAMHMPVLLSNPNKEAESKKYIAARHITKGYAAGGASVITDVSFRTSFGAPASAKITDLKY